LYHASAFYREKYGWHFPEELKFAIEIYNINVTEKPKINKIKEVARQYVSEKEDNDKETGKINNILPNGKVGFISPFNFKENVFFRLADIDNSKGLRKGDKVKFEIIVQDDGRTRAINITRER